jgi:hypothetical protein
MVEPISHPRATLVHSLAVFGQTVWTPVGVLIADGDVLRDLPSTARAIDSVSPR